MTKETIKPSAIVVEDQPVIWDYIQSCLEPCYKIEAFCSSTQEAENAFRKIKPDLVWLDCYLGEISESYQGVKNSGLQLAEWIKSHSPKTKIFLFTASSELAILATAQELGIEGIALGGKFIKKKEIIKDAIKTISYGSKWISPSIFEDIELDELANITVFEFCVIFSLLIGKSTIQIAEELDTSRKRVNNSVYRTKQKLGLDENISKEELLEIFKDRIQNSINTSQFYNLSELVSINSVVEHYLNPVINKIKTGELAKMKIGALKR